MPTCCAASTALATPVNDNPGSGGGGSPDPERPNVRLSIFKDPVDSPTVVGAKSTSNETVAPPSIFIGSAGMVGNVNTPVAGPATLMLLMKATVFPVLLICTCADEINPTCVGLKITAPFVPKGVLADPITDVYVRVTPRPIALKLNESLLILRRAVNVPD